ncbi:MAG: DUF4394 domain-containing protein [Pseudomonadota bacterium]|nr:DUF4394 domain-containing protein [Pseudomonadota bacterium]
MKRFTYLAAAIATAPASSATAAHLSDSTGYALTGNGKRLVIYDSLGSVENSSVIKLDATIDAIAYRPVTGELYGLSKGKNGDKIVVIDTMSGTTTDTGATFNNASIGDGAKVGFDFNNAIDAARGVSTADDNVVFFPSDFQSANANTVQRFTDLFYRTAATDADGDGTPDGIADANAGVNPTIFANAYTNAIAGAKASTTFQYALDSGTNSLVSLANNAGILDTIAKITFNGKEIDFTSVGGFDIISKAEGDNTAIALLNSKGKKSKLFEIDLTTGFATLVGNTGMKNLSGFAASAPTPEPVPLPASALLLGGAIAGGAAFARKRRKA